MFQELATKSSSFMFSHRKRGEDGVNRAVHIGLVEQPGALLLATYDGTLERLVRSGCRYNENEAR